MGINDDLMLLSWLLGNKYGNLVSIKAKTENGKEIYEFYAGKFGLGILSTTKKGKLRIVGKQSEGRRYRTVRDIDPSKVFVKSEQEVKSDAGRVRSLILGPLSVVYGLPNLTGMKMDGNTVYLQADEKRIAVERETFETDVQRAIVMQIDSVCKDNEIPCCELTPIYDLPIDNAIHHLEGLLDDVKNFYKEGKPKEPMEFGITRNEDGTLRAGLNLIPEKPERKLPE